MTLDRDRRKEFQELYSVIITLESGPVKLDAKDIIELYFIEDIFSFCMTGKLIFNDVYGFFEVGPFTGNEQIVIEYGRDEDRQLIFDIWKVKDIKQASSSKPISENIIELYFVDPIFELYTLKTYSRGFTSNTKISDIAKHVFRYMLNLNDKYLNIEESLNKLTDFCIPNWNPMNTISWLMKRAKGKISETSGYLCYNNTEEGFLLNFVTMNYLLGERNYLEKDNYFIEGREYKRNKILEWWISGVDKNSMKMLRGGKWIGFDSSTKQPINTAYDYSDGIKNSTLLGRKSLFIDISDSTTNNFFIGENDSDLMDNIVYSDWSKRYNMQQIVNVVVKGYENRYAGQQITVEWPSNEKIQKYNKMLKGKYLVKSITHMLSPRYGSEPYLQRLVLIKNAYVDVDVKDILKATNFNV